MQTSSQIRTYQRSDCVTFRKTKEVFGGLSNMAGGYPLKVNGVNILTSEALYQACRFPHLPDVQKLIIAQNSPMTAKMKSKPYRNQSRSDWDKVRVNVMRWCLRVKLVQNWDKFGQLLLDTGDKAIVEDSSKDDFWGAIPTDDHELIGVNALGRLLMELRENLKNNPDSLKVVQPLTIDNFLLLDKPIEYLLLKEDKSYMFKIKQGNISGLTLNSTNQEASGNESKDEKIVINSVLEDKKKEDNIFEDWVLPKLEKILQTYQTSDLILEKFKTVNKKQMQDWLKLAIELGKVEKIGRPVKYIWYSAYVQKSNDKKSKISSTRTTRKRQSNYSRKKRSMSNQDCQQLSLIEK